jgi:predicted Zn-dependent protease
MRVLFAKRFHPVWILLLIAFGPACQGVSRALRVPISAIEKPFNLSPADEAEIGKQFAKEAKHKLRIVKLGEVDDYVNEIGQRILVPLGAQPFDYHFTVIQDPHLNAFAVPGGYIYVHSALIDRVETPDELASVLAHEVAHVKARHLAKQMRKANLLSLGALTAALLSRGDQAATIGSQALQQQLMLNFSRDFEREADQLGLNYLHKAGFNPQAMISFFEKILQEQRFNAAQVPPYLLMHPLTQDRIGSVEDLIRVLRIGRATPAKAANSRLGRVQALLKAESTRQDDAVREYHRKTEREPNQPNWHHYLGIVYLQHGRYELARAAYERARDLDPSDASVHADLGMTYLKLDQIHKARTSLLRSLALNPNNARTHNTLGKVSLQEKSWQEAISHNQTALRLFPQLAEAYYDIGVAYAELGDSKEAHYFLGVAYRQMEEKEKSLQNFDKALRLFGKDSSRGRMILKEMREIKEEL